jgi:hypothetical protein
MYAYDNDSLLKGKEGDYKNHKVCESVVILATLSTDTKKFRSCFFFIDFEILLKQNGQKRAVRSKVRRKELKQDNKTDSKIYDF